MYQLRHFERIKMDIWTSLAAYSFVETQRLFLRPLTYLDADDFFDISGNPDQLDFIFPAHFSKSESDYLMTHTFLKNPLGIWAISCKNKNRMIGVIRLEQFNQNHQSAEISYFLHKDYRGQGYMSEALKTLVFLCFQEFLFKKLFIITHLENTSSQKVAQKAGFKLLHAFKGSDRYSHKMRHYLKYQLQSGDYHE